MVDVSHINFSKSKHKGKETVLKAVKKAMQLAKYKKHVKGDKVFIKPNLLSFSPVPGQCTSPWVLEGVVKVLSDSGYDLSLGDADVATRKQVERAGKVWGAKKICKDYGIKFVNLSKQKTETKHLGGEIFHKMKIPKILVDSDSIVTVPVLKMHNVTGMTFSLKNQWGCLTTVRHRYHLVAHKCIPEINRFLNVTFAVGDATICMEGDGPVTGKPVIVNSVLASSDRVAIDSAGCKIMGLDPKNIGHIVHAKKLRIGDMKYSLKGDKLPKLNFKKPILSHHPIVNLELKLRKIPGFAWLLFETPVFKIPAFIASRYNTVYWYNRFGKPLTKEILSKEEMYKKEFSNFL